MFIGLFDSNCWALSTFNDESKGLSATQVDDFASAGTISSMSMPNSAAISRANSYLLSPRRLPNESFPDMSLARPPKQHSCKMRIQGWRTILVLDNLHLSTRFEFEIAQDPKFGVNSVPTRTRRLF